MIKKLLLMLAVTSTCYALPTSELKQENVENSHYQSVFETLLPVFNLYPAADIRLYYIKKMLEKQGNHLRKAVINKVVTSLKCVNEYDIDHNHILTIIDYSLPSSQKRLWVFDLSERKLLFHTYVSHGIKSGRLISDRFSNKHNSKASSIGVYKTEKAYYGRHGLALKLKGLDRSFNDNAYNRFVVMHGSWYVNADFIKRYGRPGRSWGCPSLPVQLTKPIIDTIKDNALFVAYYPSDKWFSQSKFLNCQAVASKEHLPGQQLEPEQKELPPRDEILFADINKNDRREQNEPIVVISADRYEDIFQSKVPLTRMLRRQIEKQEYIALNNAEFKQILNQPQDNRLNTVYFIIPEVKKLRGYWATEMKKVKLGNIKEIKPAEHTRDFIMQCQSKPDVVLKAHTHFIRWLGL